MYSPLHSRPDWKRIEFLDPEWESKPLQQIFYPAIETETSLFRLLIGEPDRFEGEKRECLSTTLLGFP
jgi:hypothetical protein